jgi:hypothetical protein
VFDINSNLVVDNSALLLDADDRKKHAKGTSVLSIYLGPNAMMTMP